MKNMILIGLLIFNIASCQKKENDTQKKIININKMTYQPIYTLKISVANPYETYVNDMPLEIDYQAGSTNNELPINNYILKSGIQEIKIVLLPDEGKKIVDRLGINYVAVKIYKYPRGLDYTGENRVELIKEINLRDLKESPLLVKTFQIDIDVPYNLQGWSESVDLKKENQKELNNELVNKFNEFRDLLKIHDVKSFLSKTEKSEKDLNEALFLSQEEIKSDLNDLSADIKNIIDVYPIENYEIKFYGNGRIITLLRIDGKLKGTSVLRTDKADYNTTYNLYFHRPKPGSQLEVIR
ncbi:hypothetical protein [Flavobacterium hibernum]|uniref:Uncharacterized protein n=1 Tax=Flavobacterium hibernum TaxID=37752 RepID=A0A0D0F1E1_9FLAO|nr:hypothetical protein [Flavobacterium hibernum]KIO51842.1 hypothetical protein IW18_16470 [Flavobacterium hibernum]OXA84282.1 hypothetical protein B0A73_20610 [Flavobacterium hibernum]